MAATDFPITLNIDVRLDTRQIHKLHKKLDGVQELLDLILTNQRRQIAEERLMSEALDRVTREVAETRTVVESAITLISSISQQIRDHADDEEKLLELADDLDAQQATLAAAVVSGTPGAGSGGTGTGSGDTTPTEPVEPATPPVEGL